MKEPKVHILMSTYNGHKFLREQLDSIFKQTYSNFTLYVRDDGSNDDTNELLEEYIKEHRLGEDKVIIVKNKEKKNLGWKGNFWDYWINVQMLTIMLFVTRMMYGSRVN